MRPQRKPSLGPDLGVGRPHDRLTRWQAAYARLRHYAEREGHARVPRRHIEDGLALGRWVANQRQRRRDGLLPPGRVAQLEAAPGWEWDVGRGSRRGSWQAAYALLRRYAEREGHARVPKDHVEAGRRLGQWVRSQRNLHRAATLSPDHVALLEAIPGWAWSVGRGHGQPRASGDARWRGAYAVLRRYAEREGHARVPRVHVEDGLWLGEWAYRQRSAHCAGSLIPERVALLESLPGWSWGGGGGQFETNWQAVYAALHRYAVREGHPRVPKTHVEDGVALGRWVRRQRENYSAGSLATERAALLEAVPGWTWAPERGPRRWQTAYAALQHYAEREGHAQVPARWSEGPVRLGAWVVSQRSAHRSDSLAAERVALLESLPGWEWEPRWPLVGPLEEERWMANLSALRAYAEREGRARVPPRYPGVNVDLNQWAINQRKFRRLGKLRPDRAALLEAVPGWEWEPGRGRR